MSPRDRGCNLISQLHEYVMQGVVVAFRVVDGCLRRGDVIRLMNTKKEYQVDEVGVRTPAPVPVGPRLSCAFSTCSTLSQLVLNALSNLSQLFLIPLAWQCCASLHTLIACCFEAYAAQIAAPGCVHAARPSVCTQSLFCGRQGLTLD